MKEINSQEARNYPSGTKPALPVLIRALRDDQDAVSHAMRKVPMLQNIYVSGDDVTACSTNMAEVGKKVNFKKSLKNQLRGLKCGTF